MIFLAFPPPLCLGLVSLLLPSICVCCACVSWCACAHLPPSLLVLIHKETQTNVWSLGLLLAGITPLFPLPTTAVARPCFA